MTDLLVPRVQVASLLERIRAAWAVSRDARGAHLVVIHPVGLDERHPLLAVLAAPDATIHARYGGEAEPAVFSVEAAARVSPAVSIHFPIPVRNAWDNVVHWCATVQPFRTAEDAAAWSARHGMALGDVVPVDRVLALARVWYGRHLDPDWRKWTIEEARAMFASVGLTPPTWDLPSGGGRF